MKTVVTLALVLTAIVGSAVWLRFIHDPAVRARAQLERRDAVVDSVVNAAADSTAAQAARDSAHVRDTTRLAAQVRQLEARQPVVRRLTDSLVQLVPDTLLRTALTDAVRTERRLADSLARADSAWRAVQATWLLERAELLTIKQAAIDSLVLVKAAWKDAAGSKRFGFGCALGPGAEPGGFHPASVTCGIVVRF